MRSMSQVRSNVWTRLWWLVLPTSVVAGCSTSGPGVNPFKDDSISESQWTTPSAEGVLAASAGPSLRHLDWPPSEARIEPVGVPHWPLWWEDPFEDKGSVNNSFAWTYEDYVALPYGYGRFLLNTIAWPVSAVVTPPGTVEASDGYISRQALGYDHDAIKEKSSPVSYPTVTPLETQPATNP